MDLPPPVNRSAYDKLNKKNPENSKRGVTRSDEGGMR